METQVKITEKEGSVRVLEIEVPAAIVEETFNKVTDRYKSQAEIPGFRPGKAPVEMIRARHGQAIRQDTLEQLLPGAYEHAVKENDLFPMGDPNISDVFFERNKPFTFTVEITVRPEVEIKDYQGLALKQQVFEITDADVAQQIEQFREVKAEHIDVSRPVEAGDIVVCNLQKINDKLNQVKESNFEGQEIDLVEDRCPPEFLKHLPTMKIGEGKEVEITYPPNHPQPQFAGNTVLYRVWIKQVRAKKLPVLDDDFARNLGEFSDLNDLKEKVRADLTQKVGQDSDRDLREQARKATIEVNKFEVPPAIVEDYLGSVSGRFKAMGQGVDEQAIRQQFRPLAEEQFRWDYIMHEIAKKENLTVATAEVASLREAIEKNRAQSDKAEQEPIDERKLATDMLEQKVYDYLIANAQVEKVSRVLSSRIVKP